MSFLGSLVSGVFGLFGKKKQSTETTVNYQKMAASATAAGFNPLTALRNGGSAGFTTTTGPTTSQLPEALGNLGGILGDALERKLDPIKAKKRELDTALVDAQLRQLKQGPQVVGSFKPAREFLGTKVSQQLVPRLGAVSHKQTASVPAATRSWSDPPPVGGKEIPLWITGVDRDGTRKWIPNPDLPDLEQFPIPALAEAQRGGEAAVSATTRWRAGKIADGFIIRRKASEAEVKANKNSWHRGWLPTFKLNW